MAAAASSSAANAAAGSTEPVYKFYRKDFGKLATRPLHMDLDFDIMEEKVRVVATNTFVHVSGHEACGTQPHLPVSAMICLSDHVCRFVAGHRVRVCVSHQAAKEPLTQLQLNSHDLVIESVELISGASTLSVSAPSSSEFVSHVASLSSANATKTALKFEVDSKGNFLNITLPKEIKEEEQFLHSHSVGREAHGLYSGG